MSLKRLKLAGIVTAAMLAFAPTMASAAGTAAGTNITNLADLSFAVGGVTQPVIQSNAGVSTDFVVDRKININVVSNDVAPGVAITPGALAGSSVLTYTVTNTGNDVQDFALTATALAGGAGAFAGNTDTIDAGTVTVFVESGVTVGFQAGQDTAVFIDALPADGYTNVYVVSGIIPNAAVNNDVATYDLTAIAHTSVAAGLDPIEVATVGAGTLAGVDVVFADTAGASDAANDGKFSILDDFKVQSAVITVSKTAVVKSDPVNGTVTPQAIPGAVITYTITIANAAAATTSANLTTISDVLNAALLINATGASWTVTPSVAVGAPARAILTGALLADTTDANVDGLGITDSTLPGGTLTATYNTILAIDNPNGYAVGELKPGESVDLVFDVTLQ